MPAVQGAATLQREPDEANRLGMLSDRIAHAEPDGSLPPTAGGSTCAVPADMTMVASDLHQRYDLPDGATLTIAVEADRPLRTAELDLLARLAQTVERSTVMRAGDVGG